MFGVALLLLDVGCLLNCQISSAYLPQCNPSTVPALAPPPPPWHPRLPSLQGRERGFGHRDASKMSKSLGQLRGLMMDQVLTGADVICATCAGAGSDHLEVS